LPSRRRGAFGALLAEAAPLDLRIVGRTLLHAALVGLLSGVVGVLFFGGLELVEGFLLERVAGYEHLRAAGETFSLFDEHVTFRPWMLLFLPALGALGGGLLTAKFAPEAQGGGGDAMIHAFHHQGGIIRRRVTWVKGIASILTLGTGGAGGREGPTMQIGGALGGLVGQLLKTSARERRILMIAGVAGGMSAIFRTPLGAALLATEVLYRDDFEADALIPALLASVVSYSVFISVYGESTLFAHAPRYPFIPAHLPLYLVLAFLVAALAHFFVLALARMKKFTASWKVPLWARPGIGGLMLGLFCTPVIVLAGRWIGHPGQGLGLLGGGYGAVQVAITGAQWLPAGWPGVELLLLLCGAKLLASTFTIGSGGSAGDFAPSLVLGGLFGGAFGRAAQLLFHDPRIDPGAFVLVGMGTFYGGVAHVPVSALVMVCELAGSYDLLVPLMLTSGVAFIALRKTFLYHAQLTSQRDSPAHPARLFDILKDLVVANVMIPTGAADAPFVRFEPETRAIEMLRRIADTSWQDVFPVLDVNEKMLGFVTADSLRIIAAEPELLPITVAADAMLPPIPLKPTDDLRVAAQAFLANSVRELPVLDDGGRIVGFLDEADVSRAYLDATVPREPEVPPMSRMGIP
jgi:CIC family chloride channel protein